MADNSAAKSHLKWVETKLSRIDNMWEINAIINETSLKLNENLSSNNLFIDEDIADHFSRIRDKLEPVHWELITNVQWAIRNINTSLGWLDPAQPWNWPARANLTNKRNDFQHVAADINDEHSAAKPSVNRRHIEYAGLSLFARSFNLNNNPIPDITVNTALPGATPLMNLNTHLSNSVNLPEATIGGNTYHAVYSICDENWNKLRQDWADYIVEIWWREHRIINMNITPLWRLDLHTLRFDPPLTDSPLEITLSINATYNSNDVRNALGISGTNIVRNKKFKLILNDWATPLDNNAARLAEFNRYNNALPAGHKIENIIETNFEWNRHDLERKALAKILEKNWWAQYATLNEAQKEDFYQKIRNTPYWLVLRPYFDHVLWVETINTGRNRFNEFRTWFVDNERDWNSGDNIKNNHNYITYIHNNVSQNVLDFISSRLDHYLWTIWEETFLKSELTRYINDIENNKLDNDATIYNDVNNYAASDVHQMDKKVGFNRHNIWWWFRSIWRRSDTNYMRFFSWSSTSLHWETVNIHTNTDPERMSTTEPLKYDMDLKVSGRNSIEVEIKIEWEREPIRIKSWEPAALVRKIMRDWRIRYWKARAHMWFNIYKCMVQMAKDNNMSLQYRNTTDNHTRFIDINGWNIVIRDVDRLTGLAPSRWRIIFNQERFINSNKFNLTGVDDNISLRTGIDELWKHFTLAMNQLHSQYRHWVEKKFWTLFNSSSKMSLPTSFWSSPIKKLLNRKDTLDFDFDTTITSKWKNINVAFQKNKFTVNMDWLEKPIESKDLWKILNTRHKWVRIFDWKERDILEWVYSNLINKLRENGRIANTDFWVIDNITWNMYVLDMDWRFWVIARENLASEWNPLGSWRYWRLNHEILDRNTVDWFEHSSPEEKELMRNPFLMQRFVKSMNKRLWRR